MASPRSIISLVVLATIISIVNSAAIAPKDLIVGSRQPDDHMLQRDFFKVPSKWLQTIHERKTYAGDNYSKITQVKLLDQNKKGNGASAVIVTGGPGMNFVTIDFKSQRGHSIDYIVEIYGK